METARQETRYRLADGVFYRQLGKSVYVRNVDTHYDYLFNSIVKDILDALREERTMADIIMAIVDQYNVVDIDSFRVDIEQFTKSLISKGIVQERREHNDVKNPIGSVTERVQDFCYRESRLWNVCLELTYRCNEKCIHCYLDDPKEQTANGELSLDDYKRIIDELSDMGCMNILVTGGEPTLRHDFLDICSYIVSKGMLLDIFTNALSISDKVFDTLCTLKVNSVSFSLYGGTASFHDSITRVSGSFEKSLRNIMAFKCAGVDVYIKTILFKNHFDEFLALREIGRRLNIKVAESTLIAGGHSGRKLSDLMLSKEDFKHLYQLERADNEKNGIVLTKAYRNLDGPICGAGKTSLSINPFGVVYSCNSVDVPVGDIHDASLKHIWGHSDALAKIRAIRFRDLDEKCYKCPHSVACTTCLGVFLRENDGELHPCSYTCRNAQLRYNEVFAK